MMKEIPSHITIFSTENTDNDFKDDMPPNSVIMSSISSSSSRRQNSDKSLPIPIHNTRIETLVPSLGKREAKPKTRKEEKRLYLFNN